MSYQILPPIATFTDLDGSALQFGYLYFGQPNTNPEIVSNQITIYWDEGLTIPAAQPIRTVSGYPSRQGAPAEIFSSVANYSISVKNKNRVLIFSALTTNSLAGDLNNSSDISLGDALVAVKRTLTGAIATTQHNRNEKEPINAVSDFGAMGDDSTNNNAVFQTIIAAAAGSNRRTYFPAGIYQVTANGLLSLATGIQIYGDGIGQTIFKVTALPTADLFTAIGAHNWSIKDCSIDMGDFAPATGYGAVAAQLCNGWLVQRVEIKKIGIVGVSTNGGTDYEVSDCVISKTTAASTRNQAINCSTAAGDNKRIRLLRNRLVNSAIDFSGNTSEIRGNNISGWKFGAGITTEQDANTYDNKIIDNLCYGSVGTDTNGNVCQGIENWGGRTTIALNKLFNNAGSGLDQGGQNCNVYGNECYNNGVTVNSPGINSRYGNSTYNANNSSYYGNVCYDQAGAGGTQTYGYADSVSVTGITLGPNNFNNNKIAPTLIASVCSEIRPRFSGSAIIDPASLGAGARTALTTMTVPGAALGDQVTATSFSLDQQGVFLEAYVSAANTVSYQFTNQSSGTVDLASGTLYITVEKRPGYPNY